MIIGVAGQLKNGKDEIGDYLVQKYSLKKDAFARGVKNIFCKSFNVDLEFLENWKLKDEMPPGFSMTVRKSLQFIGEGFRKINKKVWIDDLFKRSINDVVITGVRYENEMSSIQVRNGQNILIYRPGFMNYDENSSESEIRVFVEYFIKLGKEGKVSEKGKFGLIDFFIINDSDLSSLYSKIDNLVVPYLKNQTNSFGRLFDYFLRAKS